MPQATVHRRNPYMHDTKTTKKGKTTIEKLAKVVSTITIITTISILAYVGHLYYKQKIENKADKPTQQQQTEKTPIDRITSHPQGTTNADNQRNPDKAIKILSRIIEEIHPPNNRPITKIRDDKESRHN